MKHVFIKRNKTSRLILFFAGWGMDVTPFRSLSDLSSDCCICYDYTDMQFEEALFQSYSSISVYAWSFGVWHAAATLSETTLNIDRKIAINGTMYPVDNEKGIPADIFDATLTGLDENSLQKFNRRMCGDKETLSAYHLNAPKRSLPNVKNELRSIGQRLSASGTPDFRWNQAIIGIQDRIFPFENQQRAWQDHPNISVLPIPHYTDFLHIWQEI